MRRARVSEQREVQECAQRRGDSLRVGNVSADGEGILRSTNADENLRMRRARVVSMGRHLHCDLVFVDRSRERASSCTQRALLGAAVQQ